MIYTKYLRSCGVIVGRKTITDDVTSHGTSEIGFVLGDYSTDTYYITEQGQAALRTVAPGVSISKNTLLTDGSDSIVVTGLPDDCWLRAGAQLIHVTGGSYTLTITDNESITFLELVGQHSGTFPLISETPVTAAAREDARWQAVANASPAQIRNWINTNITDLASARQFLITLALAVRALHDRR